MPATTLHHHDYYRLPWTLPDNGISWLEPTVLCNLRCDGCYRKVDGNPHKSWATVLGELDVFCDQRKSDCISIAGGEPLLYPHIIDLVAEVRRRGFKPVINSNGEPLTPGLLRELKRAGVFGFTFHVDSRQNRGGPWQGCDELGLNALRLQYATMLAEVGGIACSFNATVYADNLDQVPGMAAWAREHIDLVHTMVFICFRHVVPSMPFEWYAGAARVDWDRIWYHSDQDRTVTIDSHDLVARMREHDPDFEPAAYLNGTQDPSAFKWLLTMRVGNRERIFGYPGPKLAEAMTAWHHFRTDRYLAYMAPGTLRHGRTAMLLLWPLDRRLRRAAAGWLRAGLRDPRHFARRAHVQSIMFIQPVDFMEDGEQSMCDGCPDITVHDGKLVWSCRLEERKQHGAWLRTVPRADQARG